MSKGIPYTEALERYQALADRPLADESIDHTTLLQQYQSDNTGSQQDMNNQYQCFHLSTVSLRVCRSATDCDKVICL